MIKLIEIVKSEKPDKKLKAVFDVNGKEVITHFGQKGASDYTIHKNELRKKLYLNRHRQNETWSNPITAGSLSRYVLWNLPNLDDSINDYKRRFKL
jgi:hypothetical protein